MKYVALVVAIVGLSGLTWILFSHTMGKTHLSESSASAVQSEYNVSRDAHDDDTIVVAFKSTMVTAGVALLSTSRIRGLSGRPQLGPDEGLFFIFPHDSNHGIWMKDMLFPIDIIWFDKNLTIVDIKTEATPDSFPEVFEPKSDARYVLEVPAGFTEQHNVGIGDSVVIRNQ